MTHTPPGQLSARLLHDGSRHVLYPLSVMVNRIYLKALKPLSHIAGSTEEVTKFLSTLMLDEDSILCKLDVKDFS